jgi:hypothetical protein
MEPCPARPSGSPDEAHWLVGGLAPARLLRARA